MKRFLSIISLCLLSAALFAQQTYTLTVNTLPQGLGLPNIQIDGHGQPRTGSYSVPAGSGLYVWLQDIPSGWKVASWRTTQGTATLSPHPGNDEVVELTMPAENVTLTAVMEYNPDNPDNPMPNGWYPAEGKLVIDYMNGSFTSVLRKLIPDEQDYQLVRTAVFGGYQEWFNEYELTVERFPYLHVVDLGNMNCPSWKTIYQAYDKPWTEVVLPPTINEIYRNAFENTFLDKLTLYSTVPPRLFMEDIVDEQGNVMGQRQVSFPSSPGMVVYVPEESVPLYKADAGWGVFDIQPIVEHATNLWVQFMQHRADDVRQPYAGMTFELTNVKNLQKRTQLVSSRQAYEFSTLPANSTYDLRLVSRTGSIAAEVKNITLVEGFNPQIDLSNPKEVTPLSLRATLGSTTLDASQYSCYWLDRYGHIVSRESKIDGIIEDETVRAVVTLNDPALKATYRNTDTLTIESPISQPWSSDRSSREVVYGLQAIPTYRLTTVVGRADGELMSQPVRQTIYRVSASGSEKVRELTIATITPQGTVSSGPQEPLPEGTYDVTVSADNANLTTATQRIALFGDRQIDFSLKEAAGSAIRVNWKHFDVAAEGAALSDARGSDRSIDEASLTLRSITDGHDITDFAIGANIIRLHEQLPPGTEVELTLGSRLNSTFAPVSQRQKADADGNVKMAFTTRDYGSLHVSFRQTECSSVVLKLLGSDGQLRSTAKATTSNEATFTLQPDGNYTVVAIDGSSPAANAMNTLGDLQRFLIDGRDYALCQATITSGTTADAVIDYVPVMSSDVQLYTISAVTQVVPKKTVIGAGLYQTISTRVAMKPEYKGRVRDMKVEFDIDESDMHFVAGSPLLDNVRTNYTIKNGHLEVPIADNLLMRFCVVPIGEGERTVNARLSFLLDGELVEQPLPSMPFTVQGISFNVPERVATNDITLTGSALPNTLITIHQNGKEVAQTLSNPAGEWSVECTLESFYNQAVNAFYASYTTVDGYQIKTPTSNVTLDRYGIFATQVKMSHYNAWTKHAEEVVFDLVSNKSNRTSYPFYHESEFNFNVSLNVSDSTYIDDVILYVYTSDGEVRHYSTTYNASTKTWMCSDYFSSSALPASVAVNAVNHAPTKVGEQLLSDDLHQLERLQTDYEATLTSINEQVAAFEQLEDGSDAQTDALRTMMINVGFYPEELGQSPYPDNEQGLQQMMEDADKAIVAYEEALAMADAFQPAWDFLPLAVSDVANQLQGFKITPISSSARAYYAARSRGEQPTPLPAAGPNEVEYDIDCEGGDKIFCRMHDDGYILVLPFEDMQIEVTYADMPAEIRQASMELQQALAGARAMQQSPLLAGDDFSARMMGYLDKVYTALNDLGNKISNFVEWVENGVKAGKEAVYSEIHDMKLKVKAHENVYWHMNPNREKFANTSLGRRQLSRLTELQKSVAQKCAGLRAHAEKLDKVMKAAKGLGTLLSGLSIIGDVKDLSEAVEKTINLYYAVPDPCKLNPSKASSIRTRLAAFGTGRVGQKCISLFNNISAVAAALGGTVTSWSGVGAAIGWGGAMVIKTVNWGVNLAADSYFSHFFNDIEKEIKELKCDSTDCRPANSEKCCKTPNCKSKPPKPGPPNPRVIPILDPSGYVYEAVADNRVSDALATIYYKDYYEDMYGDRHERTMLWDAEPFAQQNPMLTDENGEYGWDVPTGLWQVRVTKDGYEDTESEWLPVPPPQLDVNLPLRQASAPVVSRVKASEEGVEVVFDKYMKPAHLTADNIFVTRGGEKLQGTIVLKDAQSTPDSLHTYARRLLFAPTGKLNIGESVRLTVRAGVESYANVGMTADFTQDFYVEQHVSRLVADSIVGILVGDEQQIVISAYPATAAQGKKVQVTSLSSDIAQLAGDGSPVELTLNSQGSATLTVKGRSIGTTALRLQLADDPEVQTLTVVGVRSSEGMMTRMPTASLISGIEVKYGTTLRLQSATPDAQIFYTLDGSCPCDNPDRLRYDGSIVLTKDVTVKALAVAPGYAESDVATFNYKVITPEAIETIEGDRQFDPVYDLKGVKVDVDKPMNKGIYLRRGKKVVVN